MDVFLVLSGLGLYYSWKRLPDAAVFYRRRLARVLVPYLMVALPGWAWLDLVHDDAGVPRLLGDITFVTFFTDDVKWFWYVLISLVCYAMFPHVFSALDGACDHVSAWLRTLLMCGLCMQLVMMLDQYDPGLYDNVDIAVNRVPSFIVGCLVGKLSYERRRLSMKGVLAGLAIVVLLLYPLRMATTPVVQVLLRALLDFLGCICGIVLLSRLEASPSTGLRGIHDAVCRILGWFGRYSLELYLLHVLVRKVLNVTGHSAAFPQYEMVVVLAALMLSVPLNRLSKIIQRPLMEGRRPQTAS